MSLPAWGVWIEIRHVTSTGARGLRRSPHGECGLKYTNGLAVAVARESLPAWGVWIEISI